MEKGKERMKKGKERMEREGKEWKGGRE